MDLIVESAASALWGNEKMRCALGKTGFLAAADKREGDNKTPIGRWVMREVIYRADRMEKPVTALPVRVMQPDDGWCDASDDVYYNRQVKLPYPASAEQLWREDHLYDVVAVIGFNDDPVVAGKGSAIFLHYAKPDYGPTAGCVALKREDLVAALEQLAPGDRILIR